MMTIESLKQDLDGAYEGLINEYEPTPEELERSRSESIKTKMNYFLAAKENGWLVISETFNNGTIDVTNYKLKTGKNTYICLTKKDVELFNAMRELSGDES